MTASIAFRDRWIAFEHSSDYQVQIPNAFDPNHHLLDPCGAVLVTIRTRLDNDDVELLRRSLTSPLVANGPVIWQRIVRAGSIQLPVGSGNEQFAVTSDQKGDIVSSTWEVMVLPLCGPIHISITHYSGLIDQSYWLPFLRSIRTAQAI